MTRSTGPARALPLRGLLALVLVFALAGLCLASYQRAFSDEVMLRLDTPRSGLLLEPGADVALRNVSVGRVDSVRPGAEGGAVIELAVKREYADLVDPASGARIVSPTLLGPKYVELGVPADAAPAGASDGTALSATAVQIEANAAFEDLVSVLDGVQPAQLNTALGAFATTLEGRGAQLGDYLEQANAYFARFNASLPTMERDLDAAADVSRIYAELAPQLLAVLDATTTTGATVVAREQALGSLLDSLTSASDTTRTFLATNRVPLRQAMELLRPTTTTLARYAPMFPCLFFSLNDLRKAEEPASGGTYPGLWVHLTVLPGADGYDRTADLPEVAADDPDCAGGPVGPNGHYVPEPFDDNAPTVDTTDAPLTNQEVPLSIQLFGTEIQLPPAAPTAASTAEGGR